MALDISDKLAALRLISQQRLTDILDSIGGTKDLVIDSGLVRPLDRFIGFKTLRSHGVEKIFKLDKKEAFSCSANVVFLLRGDLITVKRVCDQIKATAGKHQFHLIVLPKVFHAIHVLVEEEGMFEKVVLHSFQWELLLLDHRLLSFESPEVFKSLFVANDSTYTLPCAKSLWTLQHVLGKPKVKLFLGANAKNMHYMMSELDENVGEPDLVNSEIGLLLVVDRNIDFVSTLLTPGTYTSLLAEVVGINSGLVQIPRPDGKVGPTSAMMLSSDDETYNQIRHQHYTEVVLYLKEKLHQFNTEEAKRKNMTVKELQVFVQNDLGKMANAGKNLTNHLHLCEKIDKFGKIFEGLQSHQGDILTGERRRDVITFIEDLIVTGEDINLVLRLICLLSVCQSGLTQQEANSLKLQFLHAYGHEHLATFYNLEKMGLLMCNVCNVTSDAPVKLASKVVQAVTMPRKNAFLTTANKLKLFPEADDYSLKNPHDLGYVFGGIYIPLIAQLVCSVLKKDRSLRELLKCLPVDFADGLVEGCSLDVTPDLSPNCVWIYIVGGITYAEIAAFALLEKKTGCRIICSGSSIINGNSLIQSAI